SRNTVTRAYELLAAHGFVVGHAGAGTRIASTVEPDIAPRRRAPTAFPHRPVWLGLRRDFGRVPPGSLDLRPGVPDARAFPHTTWRRLLSAQLQPETCNGRYGDATGNPALRAAIATHVAASRGVNAAADDIIVTQGTQHGIDLIARVL